jgi:hypothetical protein
MVEIWKGLYKPLAVAATAFAVVAGFLHYVVAGGNSVQAEDDEAAREVMAHPDQALTAHPEKPAAKSTVNSVDQPTVNNVDQPTVNNADKPTVNNVDKPR